MRWESGVAAAGHTETSAAISVMMLFFHVNSRSEAAVTKCAGMGPSIRAMRSAAVAAASGREEAAITRMREVSWLTCSGVDASDDFTSERRGRYMAGRTAATCAIMSAMCPPHSLSLIHGHKRAAYASNTVG
jgi:hypothetical protein